MKKLTDWVKEAKEKQNNNNQQPQSNVKEQKEDKAAIRTTTLSTKLEENLTKVRQNIGGSADLIIRKFSIGEAGDKQVAILYIDGLVDASLVQNFILKTLMIEIRKTELQDDLLNEDLSVIMEKHSLTGGEMKKVNSIKSVESDVLSGDTVVLFDGEAAGLTIGTKGWEHRGVEEPSSQTVVRGPKEGFNETLRTNTALLRRKIKDPNLWIEQMKIGEKTQTDVAIVYLNGVVNEDILKEVKQRLKKIKVDGILESGYLEEFIQDETYTPFPTIYNTERPDAVAAGLLEGKIAIIVDGTPFVLTVPALFVQFMQSSEDYYQRADIASFLRLLRFVSFLLALLVPSAYIAVTTFHQEMLPTTLLISLAAQREGVPFPAVIEALIMEITFEILREAGTRMPRAVGNAISIVGALVLGQAAVEAGIVSASMVIVVSLTAISSFVMPEYNLGIAVRLLRFIFMLLAASFGLFGIIIGIIFMILHLCSLRSMGVPYLSPMAPYNKDGQEDSLVRLPHWALFKRPRLISQKDIIRENTPSPKPDQAKE